MSNKMTNKIVAIKKLSTGNELSINVIEISGKCDGPVVYIQSSVHGAETQGNLVIYKLIEYLKNNEITGKVILVPNANPYACIQKSGPYTQGRFNPVSGNNYNRNYIDIFSTKTNQEKLENFIEKHQNENSFKQDFKNFIGQAIDEMIEDKKPYGLSDDFYLNVILQKISSQADICLDLHTGPIACEYLYSNSSQEKDVTDNFPFEFILDIPIEFAGAMDEAFFMNYERANQILIKHNKKEISCSSFTVELGSEENVTSETACDFVDKINVYLSKRGLFKESIKNIPKKFKKKYITLENYKTYYSKTAGHIEYLAKPGEQVLQGEDLAVIYTPTPDHQGFQPTIVKCLEDAWVINHQNSSVVHEGMEIYQVGEKAKVIPAN
jgi:uncharacterized protein